MNTIANVAWQIPDCRLEGLKAQVARLARRSAKLGTEPVILAEVHHDAREFSRYNPQADRHFRWQQACTWVEVSGPAPVVAGHTFIARVEHTEVGNLVSRPDETDVTDLTIYRTAKPVCDHCGTMRFRKDTFVLRTPEGTMKQIGRNCLADFLRSGDVDTVLHMAELVDLLRAAATGDSDPDEGSGGGGGWNSILAPAVFLACAVSAERTFGWKSSKEGNPTKETALFLAGPPPHDARHGLEEWTAGQPTKEDCARAQLIIDWAVGSTQTSDYAHNLRVAVQRPIDVSRTAGLVASAVIAYAREVEHAEKAKRERAERKESTYFGEVGKRYDVSGTVLFVRHIEGQYGTTTLVGFVDSDGHMFKWFASGGKEFKVGEVVEMKGTVKKHEEYKGEKGTVLTRCKVKAAAA